MGSETFEGIYFEKYNEGLKVLLNYIFSALNFALMLLVSLLNLSRYALLITEIGGSSSGIRK